MDIIDRAQELEERQRADAIARRSRMRGFSVGVCDICGSSIPPARLAAVPGVATCVDCQAKKERADRGLA
ncbi:MAG: conjugal transfer protein TraR [Proteobacteria bacterium]|nr:MAG: conjugal transfer protein TraR [Pseudomonadota bacterium]